MSWSISAIGKASLVAKKVTDDLAKIKCQEPEETIKNKVGEIVVAACEAFASDVAINVQASGSQWKKDDGTATNNLNVKIEPIYGLVEA